MGYNDFINSCIDAFCRTILYKGMFLNATDELVINNYNYKSFDNLYYKGHSIIYSNEFDIHGNKYIIDNFHNLKNKLSNIEQEYMHSFEWLLHLKAIGTIEASEKAKELIRSWLDSNDIALTADFKIAWNINVVAKRVFNILVAFSFLNIENQALLRQLILSLNKQIKHLLNWHNKHKALNKIKIYKTFIVLCVFTPKHSNLLSGFLDLLIKNIKQNILHDGGHVSRNPEVALDALHDILIVYDVLKFSEPNNISFLRESIDKIASFIRTLRHNDGTLAVFNGSTESTRYKINFLLSLSHISSNPFFNLKNSNYIALRSKNATAIIDLGEPKNQFDSLMAFELSFNHNKVITNLGNPSTLRKNNKQEYAGRAGTSSLILKDQNGIISLPLNGNNKNIKIEKRTEDDWEKVSISYYGLEEKYGISYHKTLYLSRGPEMCVLGENLLNFHGKNTYNKIVEAYVRMHFHPNIDKVELYEQSKKILFPIENDKYFFNSPDSKIKLSKSSYYGREIYGEKCYTVDLALNLDGKSAKVEWNILSIDSLSKILKVNNEIDNIN